MQDLHLPHRAPLRFARQIISKGKDNARVLVKFDEIPSLAMLIEAAAQSSAAFGDGSAKMGFLVSLKNVKLTKKASRKNLEVEVHNEHNLESMKYINFEVFEDEESLANGSLVVSLRAT